MSKPQIQIKGPETVKGRITIDGSKSESNRLLILKSLFVPNAEIIGLSASNDTQIMRRALQSNSETIDVEDAGTAMRFLLSYMAITCEKPIVLKGSSRMHERPIGVLVDQLKHLGAKIEYLEKENFPPLRISPANLKGNQIVINSEISSQYISALMMIAPKLENGLEIHLQGKTVSKPYLELTAHLMRELGLEVIMEEGLIKIDPANPNLNTKLKAEADWSSASYWFLVVALSKDSQMELKGLQENSRQGDRVVQDLFSKLGVKSNFKNEILYLEKQIHSLSPSLNFNLIDSPDLAQTLIVAMAALKITGKISGLRTLKIKETDRLVALKTELEKTGAKIQIGDDFLEIIEGVSSLENTVFNTWKDHRMAMSFAALSLISPITILEPQVVNKSYPNFWEDMKQLGFSISE